MALRRVGATIGLADLARRASPRSGRFAGNGCVPAMSEIWAAEAFRDVLRPPRCRAASRRGYFEVIKPRRGDFEVGARTISKSRRS